MSALSGRAALAFAAGDLPLAGEDLARAVSLDPADAALRYNLALVHRHAGRPEEAPAELRRAAELAPDDEDIAEQIAALAQA